MSLDVEGLIRSLRDAQPWRERANCRGEDPSLFFPDQGGSRRAAKKVCTACPVKSECAAYAEAADEPYGMWGGEMRKRTPSAGPTTAPLSYDPVPSALDDEGIETPWSYAV